MNRDGDLLAQSRLARAGLAVMSAAVLAAVGAVAFAVAAVAAPASLRWATAALLLVLLGATVVLCAHAGGHAWFVPLPAFVLAVVWALTASARSPAAGWWLVALSAAASGGGVVVASTALRQRLRGNLALPPPLRGSAGVAVTALTPVGVVQVAGESWSAESVSGPLPVGSPVHVLRVRGVRLEVWSEVGRVPDANMLDTEEDEP